MKRKISFGHGQAMVELITTYSWVLLIVSIFVAIVFVLSGSPSGIQYTPSSCTIQPLLPCQDTALANYSYSSFSIDYYAVFTNQFRQPIMFPTNAFNLSTTGIGVAGQAYWLGNCNPAFASPGATVYCIVHIPGKVEPPLGTKVNTLFTVSYYLCGNFMQSSCSTSLYKSSGYATQTIAPTTINFYNVTLTTNDISGLTGNVLGTNAILYLNGVGYTNGDTAVFTAEGNYIAYITAPSGFSVSYIRAIGGSHFISTTFPTTLWIRVPVTNAIVQTTNLQCGVCYPGTGPVGNCPYGCSTVTTYTTSFCNVQSSSGNYFEC